MIKEEVANLEYANVIVAVRDIISEPSKWCKDVSARDVDGFEVLPTNPTAVCWCILGALNKHTGGSYVYTINNRLRVDLRNATNSKYYFVSEMNDALEHSELIKILDKIIDKVDV